MSEFPPERIRNLSIIAHIDHGKSTLADRLLQMTNTVPSTSSPQFLDKLKVERERGITVKAQTVSIIHAHTDGHRYLINLIDTPGHVDFSYEVSRSLGACEGGLLLVDCSQGIQAQTLSVFHVAQDANLKLLPVINKVDLPHASPDETSEQIASSLGLPIEDHMRISAKSGLGVETVLSQIIEGLPCPRPWESEDGKLRGLIFDTFYDQFRGVVSLVRIFTGSVKKGDKIRFLQADRKYDVLEVGIQNPEEVAVDILKEGQVGYLVCNMKNSDEAHIGDTICLEGQKVEPLPGFKPMKAMVYAGVFPMDSGEFGRLEEAIERLTLNDRSVSVQRESSAALSQGFRLGFLGTLHMDVFRQRLEDEYSSEVIITAPTVPYKVRFHGGREEFISNPSEFPEVTDPKSRVIGVEEPMVNATIFVPIEYIGAMMDLSSRYRGVQQEYRVLETTGRAILKYQFPLSEIVTDFFSELKSASSGFASFDYEDAGYMPSDMVKMNMLLHSRPVDALAMIVHRNAAQGVGRAWVKKLKDVLPRQLFELAIQAAIGNKIIARESIPAMRKDVTAGLYGGHYERKMKHLEKQKEGKKRLKRIAGNIDVPQSAFFEVLSSRPKGFATSTRSQTAFVSPLTVRPPQGVRSRVYTTAQTSHSHVNKAPLLRFRDFSDPISPYLDGLPDTPLPEMPTRESTPFPMPSLPPTTRSSRLSTLHRLSSRSSRASEESLLQAYVGLLGPSSSSPSLTAAELSQAIRAMHRSQKGGRIDKQLLAGMVHELQRSSSGQEAENLDAVIVRLHSGRQRGRVQLRHAEMAEKALLKLLESSEGREKEKIGKNRRAVNHVLHLYAHVGDQRKFDHWLEALLRSGVKDGSAVILGRMILLEKTGKWSEVVGMLGLACRLDDRILLINHVIWRAALKGDWAFVADMYVLLLGMNPDERARLPRPFSPSPNKATFTITKTAPTRETFSALINALSHSGYLEAGLTVMSHMLKNDHIPHIPEYCALFKGFARYGQVGKGQRGTGVFPMIEERAIASLGGAPEHGESEKSKFGRIWERGKFGFFGGRDAAPHALARGQSEEGESEWTFAALSELFQSFLQLSPDERHVKMGNVAPGPRRVWTILMAFWRMSGGDAGMVRGVWNGLDSKFGSAIASVGGEEDEGGSMGHAVQVNEKGPWEGWRVDRRLERVLRAIEER